MGEHRGEVDALELGEEEEDRSDQAGRGDLLRTHRRQKARGDDQEEHPLADKVESGEQRVARVEQAGPRERQRKARRQTLRLEPRAARFAADWVFR